MSATPSSNGQPTNVMYLTPQQINILVCNQYLLHMLKYSVVIIVIHQFHQKQSLNEEIEQLSDLLKQLRSANNKFVDSKLALAALTPDSKGLWCNCHNFLITVFFNHLFINHLGKKVMIPFTTSLYVPATLGENSTVLVDIGSNIYVRKSVDDARDYFTRQISFIHNQVVQLEHIVQQKAMDLRRLEQIRMPSPTEASKE